MNSSPANKELSESEADDTAETKKYNARLAKKRNIKIADGAPFVDWHSFNCFIGLAIIASVVLLGVELDSADPSSFISERISWYLLEFIFCTIFFLELLARLYFKRLRYFRSIGNIFDFGLVIIQILHTWILSFVAEDPQSVNLRIFSMFRIFRVLRLLRLLPLEPWLIVNAMKSSLKTIGWISILLLVVVYASAILLTTGIGHNDEVYDPYFRKPPHWDHEFYFGTVSNSMISLMQIATLDGWSEDIARHVIHNQPLMLWFFLFFIVITTYGLLSVIIGVIVDNVLTEWNYNNEQQNRMKERNEQRIMKDMQSLFRMADKDNSGKMSRDELTAALKIPELKDKLVAIDFPTYNVDELFMLLDLEQKGELDIEVFLSGIMRLKGEVKSKDVLRVEVAAHSLEDQLDTLAFKMHASFEKVDKLNRKTTVMSAQFRKIVRDPDLRWLVGL